MRQLHARTGMYDQTVQTNVDKIPFLLERMGLYSSHILWPHEATPEAEPQIRYGFFALPCKSLLLQICSFLHICYYIYVDKKLQYIEVIASEQMVQQLIYVSNQQRPTDTEIGNLKTVFGLAGAVPTSIDRHFLRAEKIIVFTVVATVATCWMHIVWCPYWTMQLVWAWYGLLACAGAMVVVWAWYLTRLMSSHCIGADTLSDGTTRHMNVAHIDDAREPLLSQLQQEYADDVVTIVVAENQDVPRGNDFHEFYLYASHSYHFQKICQCSYTPDGLSSIHIVSNQPQLYGVSVQHEFYQRLAEKTHTVSGSLLYIVQFNPFVDPPLTQLPELSQTVQQIISWLIVFPPFTEFARSLRDTSMPRTRTTHNTQYVRTQCDFLDLLLRLSAGMLQNMSIVFPVDADPVAVETDALWIATCKILPTRMTYSI